VLRTANLCREESRPFGRKVPAHAAERTASRAGVDSVEHATYTNAETNALFKRSNAWLVPTMVAPHDALAQTRAGARRVDRQPFPPC
jgi:imidazolonepropionase-like amidohydrolase